MKRLLLLIALAGMIESNAQQFLNPILAGFYPDPSICRVGKDYYLINSSFAYYPGIPIFHSRDLTSWKLIGHAMNRPGQLDLAGAGVSRGLFAPAISYHKGLYYIVCTLVDKGGNFVITAKQPAGPWTDPVWLKNVDGIDPSLYFDTGSDKAYIVYNSIAPGNKPMYDGHRTIRIREFNYRLLQASNEEKILINGGTDIAKKPVWIEGPHIYQINGWYYLMCAEGGTGYHHSEVIFRSRAIDDPFEPFNGNPILTQRHLDTTRKYPITTTGHADLVDMPDGKWYAVFLGCRPYEDDHYNTGRETFLAPVHWKDGWPMITPGNEEVKYFYPAPGGKKPVNTFSGNFRYKTDFNSVVPDQRFSFLRTVTNRWYSTSGRKGFLAMRLRPETVSGNGNPSFVGFRQSHLKCMATASIQFDPMAENEKAGLVIFQNEHHFYYLCQSVDGGKPVVQLFQSTPTDKMKLVKTQSIPATTKNISLRIVARGTTYDFQWSANNKNWSDLHTGMDARFLSTKTAGGFVGSMFGLYATSQGRPSSSNAYFDWFEYQGNDDVYKGSGQ